MLIGLSTLLAIVVEVGTLCPEEANTITVNNNYVNCYNTFTFSFAQKTKSKFKVRDYYNNSHIFFFSKMQFNVSTYRGVSAASGSSSVYSVRPAVLHVLWLVHARGDLNLEIFRRAVLGRFQLIPLRRLGAGRRWPQQHLTVDNKLIIQTFVTRAVSANILNLRRRQSLGEENGGSEV